MNLHGQYEYTPDILARLLVAVRYKRACELDWQEARAIIRLVRKAHAESRAMAERLQEGKPD